MSQNFDKLTKVCETLDSKYNKKLPLDKYVIFKLNLTDNSYFLPFGTDFLCTMVNLAVYLMESEDFTIPLSYVKGDEISLLIKPEQYDGRLLKYISVLSSMASSMFTILSKNIVSFDCSALVLGSKFKDVAIYLDYRQKDYNPEYEVGDKGTVRFNQGVVLIPEVTEKNTVNPINNVSILESRTFIREYDDFDFRYLKIIPLG